MIVPVPACCIGLIGLWPETPGDVRSVGEGVLEMRIDHGPGYRVYFTRQGATVFLLLVGGDKRTLRADIATALRLARSL